MVEVIRIGPSATVVCGKCRSTMQVRFDETRTADHMTVANKERQFRCPVCTFEVVVNESAFYKQ